MLYELPYPDSEPIEIPDRNLLGIYQAPRIEPGGSQEEIVAHGIANPIGAARLCDAARGRRRVLVLCDDNTRETPARLIVPFILAELRAAGVSDDAISFLIALGTHRPMTPQELEAKLGRSVVERYPVANHRWHDAETLAHVGCTPAGLPIQVNRQVAAADFVIGLGSIFPHAVAGFSGGGKIVVPGVCGEATSGDMHWMMYGIPPAELYGHADNPVRQLIDQVALQAGLSYVVDSVLDVEHRIVGLVAGHPVQAHRVGCQISRRVHSVTVPRQAEIVLFDSYRTDLDYWQAIKGITPAGLVMRDGGIVIQVAACREGVSPSHPEVLEYGYRPLAVVNELLQCGAFDKSVAAHMIQAAEVIVERGRGFLVSPHIPRQHVARLGFLYASSPQEALATALTMMGSDASIAVLRQAGELLPLVAERHYTPRGVGTPWTSACRPPSASTAPTPRAS